MKKLFAVFAVTAITMVLIFRFAGWRAENALLPRYCEDPRASIEYVRRIVEDGGPQEGEKRRPYIIAAKLIFLVPQQADEPAEAWMGRIEQRLSERCAQQY